MLMLISKTTDDRSQDEVHAIDRVDEVWIKGDRIQYRLNGCEMEALPLNLSNVWRVTLDNAVVYDVDHVVVAIRLLDDRRTS